MDCSNVDAPRESADGDVPSCNEASSGPVSTVSAGTTSDLPQPSPNNLAVSNLNGSAVGATTSPSGASGGGSPSASDTSDHPSPCLSPAWNQFLGDQGKLLSETFLHELLLFREEDLKDQLLAASSGLTLQIAAEQVIKSFTQTLEAAAKSQNHSYSSTPLADVIGKGGGGGGGGEAGGQQALEEATAQAFNGSNPADFEDESSGGSGAANRYRSFFRRFSFRGLTKGKSGALNMFHKQHSDEVELSSSNGDGNGAQMMAPTEKKASKCKTTKIVVDVVKESLMVFMSGELSEGKPKWEKCKIVLVKAAGGHMLELYSPPKVSFQKITCWIYLLNFFSCQYLNFYSALNRWRDCSAS